MAYSTQEDTCEVCAYSLAFHIKGLCICGCGCLTGLQDGPPVFLKAQLSPRGTERVLERDFDPFTLSCLFFRVFLKPLLLVSLACEAECRRQNLDSSQV